MLRVFYFYFTIVLCRANPIELDIMNYDGSDTAVVGSSIREVRAAVPNNIKDLLQDGTKKAYLYTYGTDDGDEKGYHKHNNDNDDKGYKHFDSYHLKDADKYGYEKHSSYGKGKKSGANVNPTVDKHDKYNSQETKISNVKKSKQQADGTKHSYKVVEDVDDDGAPYTNVEYENNTGELNENNQYNEDEGEVENYESDHDGESENYENDGEEDSEPYIGNGDRKEESQNYEVDEDDYY